MAITWNKVNTKSATWSDVDVDTVCTGDNGWFYSWFVSGWFTATNPWTNVNADSAVWSNISNNIKTWTKATINVLNPTYTEET